MLSKNLEKKSDWYEERKGHMNWYKEDEVTKTPTAIARAEVNANAKVDANADAAAKAKAAAAEKRPLLMWLPHPRP